MIIAGIDEAGYGPLLGPLVVSATALGVPEQTLPVEIEAVPNLWQALRGAVTPTADRTGRKLLIADSKVVHARSNGDKLLERGVLVMYRLWLEQHECWPGGYEWTRFLRDCFVRHEPLTTYPWYAKSPTLPQWADGNDLGIVTNQVRAALQQARVELVTMRATVLPERHYNTLVAKTGNKGSALLSLTLAHLHALYQAHGPEGLVVGVDKQGGRDRYHDLLLKTFPEARLKILGEGATLSSYVLDSAQGRMVVHFSAKGEQHFLPTALASMLCKYLRESCMTQFNTWWSAQIPGLKPTAGYYQDGTRWLSDVREHLPRLQCTPEDLIRIR